MVDLKDQLRNPNYANSSAFARAYMTEAADRIAALEAQLAERAGGVKVRDLEWKTLREGESYGAVGAAITYRVVKAALSATAWSWYRLGAHQNECESFDAARAAAQADYERRILSALEATPAPMVNRPTHCGGCGETEPAKRCIGCLAGFGPASHHQQETADEIADETVETAAPAGTCDAYDKGHDDAMAGAAVHAIREMLNEIGVPQAAFIDDHVRNGLVWARRQALEEAAQVADDEAEIERSLTRREAAQSADYIAQRIRELKEGSASR